MEFTSHKAQMFSHLSKMVKQQYLYLDLSAHQPISNLVTTPDIQAMIIEKQEKNIYSRLSMISTRKSVNIVIFKVKKLLAKWY